MDSHIASVVPGFRADDDVVAAAFPYDGGDDSSITGHEAERHFGNEAARIVAGMSGTGGRSGEARAAAGTKARRRAVAEGALVVHVPVATTSGCSAAVAEGEFSCSAERDNPSDPLWVEGSDAPGGESGGIFMNGNVIVLWSPGDNDLLRVLDEDSFPTGTPVFRIANGGEIFQRGTQIHADYVFESDYELESIEEHEDYMRGRKHLRAVPEGSRDEHGNDVVEYGGLFRGLLEELEKAHLYIASLNRALKEQRALVASLDERLTALAP